MHEFQYEGATEAILSHYIPASSFRIIPSQCRHLPCGFDEVTAVFKIEDDFAKSLASYQVENGRIYGFVRPTAALKEIMPQRTLTKVEFFDWKEKFVLFLEYKESAEKVAFYIENDQVKELIDQCLCPQV